MGGLCYNTAHETLTLTVTCVNPIATRIRHLQRKILDTVVKKNPGLKLDRRAEEFVEIFEPFLPNRSRILDIGGGWGYYVKPLKARGHDVTVLDVVKPGFQQSPVVIYSGDRIPFGQHAFDASLLVTVLHHVPDPEALIREARRVTRKILVLVEDLYHHRAGRWWTIARDTLYNFEFFGHPRNFKKRDEWVELFKRQGFTLLGEKQVYTWVAGLRILNGVFIFQVI